MRKTRGAGTAAYLTESEGADLRCVSDLYSPPLLLISLSVSRFRHTVTLLTLPQSIIYELSTGGAVR